MNRVLKLNKIIRMLLVSILTVSVSITAFVNVLVYADDDGYIDSDPFDIEFKSPKPAITVSKDVINESNRNDGSIDEKQIVTLKDGKFLNGISVSDILVNNLPEGISIGINQDSDTQITISFIGNAVNNSSDSNISNANIKVSMSKVSGAVSDLVTGSFSFNFKDPTDSDIVAMDKANLQVGYKYGDSQDNVTGNVFLSTTSTNESSITWSSSNTAVIANDGIVKRPEYTAIKEDYIEVTLTAVIEKGTGDGAVSAQKSFTLKVMKQSPSSKEAVDLDTSSLSICYADGDNEYSVTKNIALPLGGSNGTQITWSSDNTNVVKNDGTVTRPVFTAGDKIVNLTAIITKGSESVSKKFTIRIIKNDITDEEAVALEKTDLSIGYKYGDNKNSVTQNVTLPISGDNGTKITWTSDTNLIISNSGAVTRPAYSDGDKLVTLTATITKGKVVDTSTFPLKVIKASKGVEPTSMPTPAASATPTPTTSPTSMPTSTPSSQQEGTGVDIIVNGKMQTAATALIKKDGNKTIAIITVDDKKVNEKLQNEGKGSSVVIPVNKVYDIVAGVLNAQTVKNMEQKEASLEIRTENVSYIIPADEIKIDDISKEVGKDVSLKDIKVNVKIAKSEESIEKIAQNTADKNNYGVVVKPVDFEIACTYGDKTVYVNKFSSYVKRMIAIPNGVDPSKITTGIVLNNDGSFSHVPTVITVINKKYYAVINSLTNSSYLVIWHPKTFRDVQNHWAKNDVNDLGSRLVISGVDESTFEPDRDITRAEFAAIVVRGLGLMRTGTGKASFKDAVKSDWYYDAVSIANEYGLIKGIGNGKFEPNRKITREEAMTIISRAMTIAQLKTSITADDEKGALGKFTDNNSISIWAKNYIAVCIDNGIVNGSNGNINPKKNITRAEVAAIVERMLQKADLINKYSSK